MSKISDATVWYHATQADVAPEMLDPAATRDGGLHFGTQAQAEMRTGRRRLLVTATLRIERPLRVRDTGGQWLAAITRAKRSGHDGIVYLNRYEGMTTAVIERLAASGDLARLDGLSDQAFRRLVPEAQDSVIVFSKDQIHILEAEREAGERPRGQKG